jgi:8-oxo-dGTP pyrophosphatase MutT (NUDIX family)
VKDGLRARLAGRTPAKLRIDGFAEAAVLVPLIRRGAVHSIAFTARPAEMPTHGGQISMPGGKRDACDRDLMATALREASEELGIDPGAVDVLGALDDVATPLGFVITPVVGWLDDPGPFVPHAREVEAVFEIGLDDLARGYRDAGEREVGGHRYRLHEYHAAGRVIWGATARMVHDLLDRIAGPRA